MAVTVPSCFAPLFLRDNHRKRALRSGRPSVGETSPMVVRVCFPGIGRNNGTVTPMAYVAYAICVCVMSPVVVWVDGTVLSAQTRVTPLPVYDSYSSLPPPQWQIKNVWYSQSLFTCSLSIFKNLPSSTRRGFIAMIVCV